MAVASLVLGILGIILIFIPFMATIAFILALIALIFGLIARGNLKTNGVSTGTPTIGVVLSVCTIALYILSWIWAYQAIAALQI